MEVMEGLRVVVGFEEPLCDAAGVVEGVEIVFAAESVFDPEAVFGPAETLADDSTGEMLGEAVLESAVEGVAVDADTAAGYC